jgi:PAS domain S-box-containing protein
MSDVLDCIFRFPRDGAAGPEFVNYVLGLLSVPALVADKRMRIRVTNLQGRETLLKLNSAGRDRPRKPSLGTLPASLWEDVKESLRSGRAVLRTGFEIAELDHKHLDVLVCPGQIQGRDLAFVVLLPPRLDKQDGMEVALDRLVGSFDVAVSLLDRQLRFVKCNKRYGASFGRRPEEVQGLKVSDLHPPERRAMLENRIEHLMTADMVESASAETAADGAHGTLPGSVTAWPFRDRDGACLGLVALLSPSPVMAAGIALKEVKQHFFGDVVELMSEAVFITNADGRILVMNGSARALINLDGDMNEADLKSAVPWRRPEIIDRLYDHIIKGSGYSAVLTGIDTPTGEKQLRVRGFALSQSGDIASEIFFHMDDVTEEEKARDDLSDMAKRLASEKEILDSVLEHTDVTFTLVARDLTIIRMNERTASLMNVPADSLIGRRAEEVHPYLRESGLLGHIEKAFEQNQEVHIPRYTHIRVDGTETSMKLNIIPVKVDRKEACLVITQFIPERGDLEAEYAGKAGLYTKLLSNVVEAVVVIDGEGRIVDPNYVVERIAGKTREQLVGQKLSEILTLEQSDLILDYLNRAIVSRRPLRTGRIRLSRKHTDDEWFAEVKFVPLAPGEEPQDGVVIIALFLTKEMQLERQIEDYTKNLEELVGERTHELTSMNTLLEGTVDRLASMAKSGMILSTLKDIESVMTSFLKEAREVLDADFVSVALVESITDASKTTYYSSGSAPPPGTIPPEVIERGLSRLVLEASLPSDINLHKPDVLTVDFAVGRHRALLLAWKAEGEFTSIDKNLSGLLCTQLSFSMPITTYVNDLRRERDRSQSLRQIAFRAAGMASVSGAIRIVAEEISKTVPADRFFWLVSNNDTDFWVSEVCCGVDTATREARRVGEGKADCLSAVLEACSDSRKLFCDRFPRFGTADFRPDMHSQRVMPCPFVSENRSEDLGECIKGLLQSAGLLGENEGTLAAAPVTLSPKSWGILCASGDMGSRFSREDSCFMCLAAATVGHMWQAADAASNVRRLETAGQTVSELAHDLKYPLMKLKDSIANVSCCSENEAKKDPGLGDMTMEVDNLSLLAQELIDISNAGSHKYEIVDVIEVLNYCISLTSSDLTARSVKINKRGDVAALPAVFVNKKELKTVFLNVLINCIDAAGEKGSVTIDVKRDGRRAGGETVCVTFTDSGPGVSEVDMARIFDPFYSRKEGGSGLGLFSAKKRANANGGDVICEMGDDGKSRFVIWFPLASG